MEKATGFTILQSTFFNDVIKEFSTTCIFHNQEKLLRSFNDLIQLNDVGMSNYFQNMYLTHDSSNICLVFYLVFLEDLDGNFLLC